MRYAKKVDTNHALIRDALRECGVEVWDLSARGGGVPDLAVRTHNGKAGFIEIKNGSEPLTELEEKFIAWFQPICGVAHTLDEAIAFCRWLEADGEEMRF